MKKLLLALFATLLLLPSTPAFAQEGGGLYTGTLDELGKVTYGEDFKEAKPLSETIGGIIKVLLQVLGLLFIILLIYGGFIWMLSRGNENEVTRAKDILQHALIGLIIVIISYSITVFVFKGLGEATGTAFENLEEDPSGGAAAGGGGVIP